MAAKLAEAPDNTIRDEVRSVLQRRPDADARWVHAAVAARHPEVLELSLRSFNARYVLPVKRRRSNGAVRRKRPAPRPSDDGRRQTTPGAAATATAREWVRAEILRLVRETVMADRARLVDVVASIDDRADRMVKEIAARRAAAAQQG